MKENPNDTVKIKVPDCKYAVPQYSWVDTEKSGYSVHGGQKKFIDLRGRWELTTIRCAGMCASEDESWKELGCFHWCHDPERCDVREPGQPRRGDFSWMASSGENPLSKDT